VLAERVQQPATGDPLPRTAHMDGPVAIAPERPLVDRVGMPRSSGRVDRAAGVRAAAERIDR
jgi:hypothetical protein